MMLVIVLVVVVVGVFTLAFISPARGRKLQKIANRYGGKAYAHLKKLPDAVQRFLNKNVKITLKTVHKSAEKGKKGRHKAPF